MGAKKDFMYTIKTTSGKVVVESIVSFGSKGRPFPKDWKNDIGAQLAIQNHKEDIFAEHFVVEVSENLEFTLKDKEDEESK